METADERIDFPPCGVKSSKDCSVFGIFDGMGGEECGEIASYLAAKNAASVTSGTNPLIERESPWPILRVFHHHEKEA